MPQNRVRAAFGQRRKTLCNTLSQGLEISKETAAAAIAAAGLKPAARPEELSLEEFIALSRQFPGC